MLRTLCIASLVVGTLANVYDVELAAYHPGCAGGCVPWTEAGKLTGMNQSTIDAMFIEGASGSMKAGSSCAMPGAHAGNNECDCGQKDMYKYIFDSYAGPWCFCKVSSTNITAMYCNPPMEVPEQINLQLAAPGVIVVGFVTYNNSATTTPPSIEYGLAGGAQNLTYGVTHKYAPPGRNQTSGALMPYNMHYVRMLVEQEKTYTYKVKSGASQWSETFTFRAPVTSGVTRVGTYGDLGHSHYNAMGNLKADAEAGIIDAIVHMGDHCYNLGFDTDRRGDAYMNAWQPTLTTVPWFPIIGNHESSDGDHFKHYAAIAYGEAFGQDPNTPFPQPPTVHSSATTALGAHLTQGTFYGMGLHGVVPSNTSRYASTDLGMIHMVGLDLNNLSPEQLAWLEKDLIAANTNRAAVPWIMVMSHFPVFHGKTQKYANYSAAHYIGDELLSNYALDGENMDFVPCDTPECETIGKFQAKIGEALQPLFKKYGVDIYNAGHVHSYESTWPLCDFVTGEICNGTQSFVEPMGTVHITEGNGGVPGVKGTSSITDCSTPGHFCRKTGTGGAYARITAWNSTHLTYDHVQNNDGVVSDSWTIVQSNHGPFAMMR